MKYTITVTTPHETRTFTEWNYYEMVTRRFHAIQHLHDLGYSVNAITSTHAYTDAVHPKGHTATIVVTKGKTPGDYLYLYNQAAALTTKLLHMVQELQAGRTPEEWKADPRYIKVSRIAVESFAREGRRHQKHQESKEIA